MSKKVIIIGAGVAGLATGCYGQINGYDTEIYEMHNIPGGLCTAWKRKGYTFDGCIHWLMGVRPGTSLYPYWEEIGALKDRQFIHHDLHMQLEDGKGNKLAVGSDLDKLEKDMLTISPEDADAIHELIQSAKKIKGMSFPFDKPQEMYTLIDLAKLIVKMSPVMKEMGKLNKISIGQFAERLKHPFLREAFPGIMPPDYTLFVYAMLLATYSNQDAGWPLGGSLGFAEGIEKSYLDLGGKVYYRQKVQSILVENDRAVGIRLEDGSEKRADFVVSAADGHTTIFKTLNVRIQIFAI